MRSLARNLSCRGFAGLESQKGIWGLESIESIEFMFTSFGVAVLGDFQWSLPPDRFDGQSSPEGLDVPLSSPFEPQLRKRSDKMLMGSLYLPIGSIVVPFGEYLIGS